jgi:glycosyltransferase involved in cell wall biosynthesis
VVRLLAAGQLRRGHSVTVAAVLSISDELPHPFVQALEAEGVRTIAIRLGDRDYKGEQSAIRSLCRKYSPDVVHTHGFRSDVINGGVARAANIAVFSTCHGFIDSDWRGRLYQWLQRRTLRRFDAVIAVSAPIQARLRAAHVPEAKIHLVPNSFSPGTEQLTREEARQALHLPEAPMIGWVGRLTNEKGADVALEAFARLGHQTARLVIVGEGSEERALRSLAVKLGVDERVHWCGAIPDASKLFTAFDVFLLSSRTEGTPIALFEAMAAGVPIVATRVGGVPDVVESLSAILVDGEDVEGIAHGLAEVFRDAESARIRAARAREKVLGHFDAERWLARYESIYCDVVRQRTDRIAAPAA